MITLDQVLLLEEKVEAAVAKIQQLEAENAALRTKCAELTNALSSKTERLSSFEQDQNKIEEGILKALDRLNRVENTVYNQSGVSNPQIPAETAVANTESTEDNPQTEISENLENTTQTTETSENQSVEASVDTQVTENIPPVENAATTDQQNVETPQPTFDDAAPVNQEKAESQDSMSGQAQFDIF